MRGGGEPECQRLGVRRGLVAAAEGLDARLQEFARQCAAVAKHRTEIAIALGSSGSGRSEIIARDRNGEIRPQAQFLAGAPGGQEHPRADVLAGEVQKRLGRLQDGRVGPRVARLFISRNKALRGDEGLRPRVGQGWGQRFGHGRGPLARMS
jgi:hypothetical protein